jgi:hypothetical protein
MPIHRTGAYSTTSRTSIVYIIILDHHGRRQILELNLTYSVTTSSLLFRSVEI